LFKIARDRESDKPGHSEHVVNARHPIVQVCLF
jgi:hypothetical protein